MSNITTEVRNESHKVPGRLYIKAGRLSYPKLDKPDTYQASNPRYGVVILIDKTEENKKAIHAAIREAAMAKLNNDEDKTKSFLKKAKANAKLSFHDGDDTDKEEYQGKWYISAYTPEDNPPNLFDPLNNAVRKDMISQIFYAGSYCDVIIHYYAQTQFNGVFASLKAVKFRQDGPRLSAALTVNADEFDDIETDSDFDFASNEKTEPTNEEDEDDLI